MYARFFKRFLDLLASLLLLLLLLPLFILVALLIKLDSRGPVFFIQDRLGKNLKLFKVYKFRTMTDKKRSVQKVIGKAEGVTRIGYYLRRFKIDELPQLINVCKGEMSLVGPRPSIQEQLEEMNVDEKRRYSVRPGMTGLAQVCGNIHISWSERYKYDLEYVENVSFLNDMKIILRTVLIIFLGEEKFINEPLKLRETQ
ncbi:sugar transferase [Halalkalibaculum sp. DA3122]|uniref:sugar transferase n=1 Tax=Halalkalibaculum sp. DA3122 TaxID=3373607 RepID=UPI0037546672